MNIRASKLQNVALWSATLVVVACAGSQRAGKAGTDTVASSDTSTPAPPPVVASQPDTTTQTQTTRQADTTLPSRKPPRVGSVDSVVKVPAPPVQAKDTAHLGRDSVIKFDMNDPRRTLPTVPATPPPKKPQERE